MRNRATAHHVVTLVGLFVVLLGIAGTISERVFDYHKMDGLTVWMWVIGIVILAVVDLHYALSAGPVKIVEDEGCKIDLDIIKSAYGWTVDYEGRVLALTSGDMGYEDTGIVIPMGHLMALIQKDHEKLEDLPGYVAGKQEGIETAAKLSNGIGRDFLDQNREVEAAAVGAVTERLWMLIPH